MDLLTGAQRDESEDEDYYQLLGCDEKSSEEQIATEFKLLARKNHPDKVSESDKKEAAEKRFMVIERARAVLLDRDLRVKYDQWRSGGFNKWVSFDSWLSIHPRVHASLHWASTQQTAPALPDSSALEGSKSTCSMSKNKVGEERMMSDKQADRPMSVEEFRKGSGQSSLLSQFRDYKV